MFGWFRKKVEEPERQPIQDLLREVKGERKSHNYIPVPLLPTEVHGLKTCPFCGGNPFEVTEIHRDELGNNRFEMHIECQACGAKTRALPVTKERDPFGELKDAWEKRTHESPKKEPAQPFARGGSNRQCAVCSMPRDYMPTCALLNGFCTGAQSHYGDF